MTLDEARAEIAKTIRPQDDALCDADTREKLIAWFESTFDCVHGAPWTYAEERPENYKGTLVNVRTGHELPGSGSGHKLTPYVAYGFTADDTDLDRRRLCMAMQISFARKIRRQPDIRGTRLYWRYEFKIELESGRIYTRLVVPAIMDQADLPVHLEGNALRSLYIEVPE